MAGSETGGGRVAVVDVGSNSVRLVVFDGLRRAPVPVFNERVFAGLGRDIAHTGRLNDEGIALARTNLRRFARLAEAMAVARFDILATAAVREATNGPAFVDEIAAICGVPVTVLSGRDEARLSAMGVLAGWPEAEGVMGDLGGGSLELVRLRAGRIEGSETLPLGPLRLGEVAARSRDEAIDIIDAALDTVPWLAEAQGGTFFPVGGAWRALAKLQMAQQDYPLHIIHGYTLPRRKVRSMTGLVSHLGPHSLSRIRGVSKRRLETLPFAALLLGRVLRRQQPHAVTFSAHGLREGHLFDLLPPEVQDEDPLTAAASDLAASEGRFGDLGTDLFAFTEPLVAGDETPAERRVRRAAAHLADIAWREHPDYRAVQALYRVLRLPLTAVDHGERAFLAYSAFIRYGGKPDSGRAEAPLQLMTARQEHRARVLGLAHRLAITVSGGTRDILAKSALVREGERLHLRLPDDGSAMTGDVMQRRLKALVKTLDMKRGEIG